MGHVLSKIQGINNFDHLYMKLFKTSNIPFNISEDLNKLDYHAC